MIIEITVIKEKKVSVDPVIVIEKILADELKNIFYVLQRDGKYYEHVEVYYGPHSSFEDHEITKDKYDYIEALKLIINKLKVSKT